MLPLYFTLTLDVIAVWPSIALYEHMLHGSAVNGSSQYNDQESDNDLDRAHLPVDFAEASCSWLNWSRPLQEF